MEAEAKPTRYQYAGWAEAFSIFAKYPSVEKRDGVSAEHDVIYAGPNPEKVSDEDKARLEELGWSEEEEFDCFYIFT